jgi:hypothetical protein
MTSSPGSLPVTASDLPRSPRPFLREWSFTLLLGIVYVAVFNLWRFLQPGAVFLSALISSALLCVCLGVGWARKYFRGFWEALLHFVVILDIFLEGVLIPVHDTHGFYWCALAFAVLIIGYRRHLRRQTRLTPLICQ